MNSTNTTTFFVNSTTKADPKRDTVVISVEEFEQLCKYRDICKDLFSQYGGELL